MRSEILQEILNEMPESVDNFIEFYAEKIVKVDVFLKSKKLKYRVERLQEYGKNEFAFTIIKNNLQCNASFLDYDFEPNTNAIITFWKGHIRQPILSGSFEFIFDELKKILK